MSINTEIEQDINRFFSFLESHHIKKLTETHRENVRSVLSELPDDVDNRDLLDAIFSWANKFLEVRAALDSVELLRVLAKAYTGRRVTFINAAVKAYAAEQFKMNAANPLVKYLDVPIYRLQLEANKVHFIENPNHKCEFFVFDFNVA